MTWINTTKLPNPFPGINVNIQPNQIWQTPTPKTNKSKKLRRGTKAGTNGTIVAVVLDESGSMDSVVDSTCEGFNEFMNGQRKDKDKTLVKVNKFEGGNVVDVWGTKDVNSCPPMSRELYCPCGGTNLLDAIGQTIYEIDDYLKGFKKKNRPAVVIMIMTDGHENMSREFSNDDIKRLVEMREEKDWVFQFFGANIDAFAVGSSFGFNQHNTMQYSTANMGDTMAVASAATSRMKAARAMNLGSAEVYASAAYTAEERDRTMKGE